MRNLKIHPNFKEKLKTQRGLRKMAKLDRMNTRFQRRAVEITLDLFKGLSQSGDKIKKGSVIRSGNYIRPV